MRRLTHKLWGGLGGKGKGDSHATKKWQAWSLKEWTKKKRERKVSERRIEDPEIHISHILCLSRVFPLISPGMKT